MQYHRIEVDEKVWNYLKSKAEPFEDTPNSVLRRFAGFDKKPSIIGGNIGHNYSSTSNKPSVKTNTTLTGKILAQQWSVNVKHALYHKDGQWYNHLRYFPGALFDPHGYIVFKTQDEYENSPYLQHGVELHVPGGLSHIPNYKKIN